MKKKFKISFIETILELSGVLKVMKNKYPKSEPTEDTTAGLNTVLWELTILDQSEEDSWFSLEIVETVTL